MTIAGPTTSSSACSPPAFGTPTPVAGSGTEEEFRLAYASWQKHGSPQIVFYFHARAEPPEDPDARAQFDKVKAFRAELGHKGIVGEYNGPELFMSTVLAPLLQIIGRLNSEEREVRGAINRPAAPPESVLAAQPVPMNKRVRIFDIGEKDACYPRRDKYIGRTGTVLEAQRRGNWLRGTFLFDTPLFEGDDGRYGFLQFQVVDADEERQAPDSAL